MHDEKGCTNVIKLIAKKRLNTISFLSCKTCIIAFRQLASKTKHDRVG